MRCRPLVLNGGGWLIHHSLRGSSRGARWRTREWSWTAARLWPTAIGGIQTDQSINDSLVNGNLAGFGELFFGRIKMRLIHIAAFGLQQFVFDTLTVFLKGFAHIRVFASHGGNDDIFIAVINLNGFVPDFTGFQFVNRFALSFIDQRAD